MVERRTSSEALDPDSFHAKCEEKGLEGQLYRTIRKMLSNEGNQQSIRKEFPKQSVERRNTGYALDLLLETKPFMAEPGLPDFNFCTLTRRFGKVPWPSLRRSSSTCPPSRRKKQASFAFISTPSTNHCVANLPLNPAAYGAYGASAVQLIDATISSNAK